MSASASFPDHPVRARLPRPAPTTARRTRSGPVARRAGHVLGDVVGLLAASLALNAVAEAVYAAVDRPRVKAAGDVVTLAVSLAVTVRLWQVFPFTFPEGTPWATVARVLLVLALVGTVLGIVVAPVTAVRPPREP